ncbi:hypothetical protein Taro_028798, partial [Colocasia esculenta]|nr:hypothetical protein [Colocasia esculenta]
MSLSVRIRAHTQAALQAQLEAQQAQVPVPQAQDHGGPSIMERFKRMSPPSFKGESDPLLAESWMREIEKIFQVIRCAEDDKVTLATYMLQDDAVEVSWDKFVRLLRAKLVSEHFQDKMEQEFLSLTQGYMTVLENEARLVAFDHCTLEQALSAACRQEGEMEQYLEENKASQKRPAAPFQRHDRMKAAIQSPQHPVASGSSQ